jgi:hypothetical protein
MDGAYEIGTDHIRALAIQSHALDTQFDKLFNSGTICDKSEATVRTYNRLFLTTLLSLAVAIRVSLAKEPEYLSQGRFSAAGLFVEGGAPGNTTGFALKDICDKIIHAHKIFKPIEHAVQGASCELQGEYRGKPWVFGLSVLIFSECVLQWLDQLDHRRATLGDSVS